MSKIKATHSGHCQCCGAVQKLPSGRLSNHGYTKEWGFFLGICLGANELPYEQSCDFVKLMIERTQEEVAGLAKKIEELRIPTEDEATEVFYTFSRNGFKKHCRIKFVEKDGKWLIAPDISDVEQEHMQYRLVSSLYLGLGAQATKLEIINDLRSKFARELSYKKLHMEKYIEYQKQRVADWKPQDLIPVIE